MDQKKITKETSKIYKVYEIAVNKFMGHRRRNEGKWMNSQNHTTGDSETRTDQLVISQEIEVIIQNIPPNWRDVVWHFH